MPSSDDADPHEQGIIERFARGALPFAGLRVGIGDDAAVFADGRLVTVDTMVEGVHWDDRLDAADVGWKLVAVNVSDIGAMGGRPEWAVLALSVPAPLDASWLEGFQRGFAAACAHWGVSLVGGDTTRAPVRMASLTLGGRADRPVLRSGGRPGDDLWVSGALGRSAEAFLADAPRAEALAWLRRPEPPAAFGAALADAALPTAMMDLSDGLRADLPRLCDASGCGATVEVSALPGDGPLAWRVAFGEDYQLLFSAPAARRDAVRSLAAMHHVSPSRIGRLDATPGIRLEGADGWPEPLFTHFGAAPAPAGAPREGVA